MRGAWLALALALGGCGPRAIPAPESARPVPSAESAEERALGSEIHEQIGVSYGFYGDRRVCAYVERVGRRVAAAARRRDVEYSFFVVDDGGVNAFAAPGGYVYVTRGLLAELGSEAELAAVLAHEVAHIDRKHALRQQAFEKTRAFSWTRADSLRFYERKRDNEREADWLAARALAEVGYDPGAVGAMLERLLVVERKLEAKSDEPDEETGWLDTHPSTLARIARAAHALGTLPGGSGRRGAAAHRSAIDGMTIGDNPERGYMFGRRWVLPRARVAFEVPPGWSHHSSGQGVFASSPDGALLFLLCAPAFTRQPHQPVERRSVAGHPAEWFALDMGPEQTARALVVELGRETLWLIAAGQAGNAAELDRLPAAFSVADPELLAERPRQQRARRR